MSKQDRKPTFLGGSFSKRWVSFSKYSTPFLVIYLALLPVSSNALEFKKSHTKSDVSIDNSSAQFNSDPIIQLGVTSVGVLQTGQVTFNAENGNLISILDEDGDDQTVTITIARGRLSLTELENVTFLSGSNGSSSMTISGTLSSVNQALDGAVFSPENNRGEIEINLSTDDGNEGRSEVKTISVSSYIDLGPGDLAFTAYNSDNEDAFAIAVLVDLDGSSEPIVINFSDNEWDGLDGFADTNEGDLEWIITTSIAAGSVIRFTDVSGNETVDVGTVAVSGTMNLGNSGDAIFAYLGHIDDPLKFISAISNNGDASGGFGNDGDISAAGLTIGLNAVDFDGIDTNFDIGEYVGARNNKGVITDYLGEIYNMAHWNLQDGSGDQSVDATEPDLPFNGTPFTLDNAAPYITGGHPLDEDDNITLSQDLVLTFNENVKLGTGNIIIKEASDDTDFEILDVEEGRVSVVNNTITLDPEKTFDPAKDYYIHIATTAVDDANGNDFPGISDETTLNFSTANIVINEVVTDPKTDWSSNDFDGTDGMATVSKGVDEFVELLIQSDGLNLSEWSIMLDNPNDSDVDDDLTSNGAFQVSNLITQGEGTFDNTETGDYLILGNVKGSSSMEDGVKIILRDPDGNIVDQVQLGGGVGNAPKGDSNNALDESIFRSPDGIDTNNDGQDFSKGAVTLGRANPDIVAPEVINVTSTTANGLFKIADDIIIQVVFDEAVIVTGTAQVQLETGDIDRTADYISGSGTATLTFNYQVQAGDVSNDLDYASVSALTAGTSIQDAAGNDAILTLAAPGDVKSLSHNKALVIDAIIPTIVSLDVPAAGSYRTGQYLEFVIHFNKAINFDHGSSGALPGLDFKIDDKTRVARYFSGNNTDTWVLRYNVKANENDSDGINLENNAFTEGDYSIEDAAGNRLDQTLPDPLTNTSGILIDNVAPILSEVLAVATPTNNNTPEYLFRSDEGGILSIDGSAGTSTSTTILSLGDHTLIFTDLDNNSVLLDGIYNDVTIQLTDAAGNVSTHLSVSVFEVDTQIPTITINTVATDDMINATEADNDLTISGTTTGVEDGQSVEVALNHKTYNSSVNDNVWTVVIPSADIQSLKSSETLTADVSDVAGNQALQVARSITYDSDRPTITINTVATDDMINATEADNDLTISGTTTGVEDGQSVEVALNHKTYNSSVNDNVWTVVIPSADIQSLKSSERLTADVSDVAGNQALQVARSITYDSDRPTITINTVATDDMINATEADNDLTISGTTTGVEDGQSVEVALNHKTYNSSVNDNVWTVVIPSADIQSLKSSETLTADVSDVAGNQALQVARSVTYDADRPTIAIKTVATDDMINATEADNDLTISGTTTGVEDGQSVEVALNHKTYNSSVNDNVWTVVIPSADIQSLKSSETLTADVSDVAGNQALQVARSITYDADRPTIAINTVATDDMINATEADNDLTISGTTTGVEDGQSVEVALNHKTYNSSVNDNVWTVVIPSADIQSLKSSETLTADVSDVAGNQALQVARSVTYDADRPTIAINTVATDDMINATEADNDLTISGTTTGVEDGQSVEVALNHKTYNSSVNDNVWTVVIPSADIQSLKSSETLTADVSDVAGNQALQVARSITYDADRPTIAINTVATDDMINATEADNDLTISGTTTGVEDGQSVEVTLNHKTYNSSVNDNVWTVVIPSADIQSLKSSETLTADVSDVAGNQALQVARSITYDSDRPTITINTVATDDMINATEADNDLTISGTTTGVEDGQSVEVTLNHKTYNSSVNDNVWTVVIPSADIQSLKSSETLTADVSDVAGNQALQVARSITYDSDRPTITINAIATDDMINATEADNDLTISGTTTGVEDGQSVEVALNHKTYNSSVNDNVWTVVIPSADIQSLKSSETLTADVSDVAGNQALQVARSITYDADRPTIAINTVATDDMINATEADNDLTISGTTTGVEDGQSVEVALNHKTYNSSVNDNVWTVVIPSADIQSLKSSETLTADVSDVAGNQALQVARSITYDADVPTIQIDNPIEEDNIVIASEQKDVILSGITDGVEDGQIVKVKFVDENNLDVSTTALVLDNQWIANATDISSLDEGDITIMADISDVAGNVATKASETIVFESTNRIVGLSVDKTTIEENGETVKLTATLDRPSALDITIELEYTGTATKGIDFNNDASTIMTVPAGQTTVDFEPIVTVINDDEVETIETIEIEIIGIINGSEDGDQSLTLTVIDDDSPEVSFATASSKGLESLTSKNLTVNLDKTSPFPVTVDYKVSGSAIVGRDFTLANGRINFDPNQISKTISINSIMDDQIVESDETIIITLSNPSNAILGATSIHTYTIINNDQTIVSITDINPSEKDLTAEISFTSSHAVDGGFEVDVSTADHTARIADGDYIAIVDKTIAYAGKAGEKKTMTITLGQDTKVESDEIIHVVMNNLIAPTVAISDIDKTDVGIVKISNDDSATITIADEEVSEADGSIIITATLDNVVQGGFEVDVNTTDGTATSASDFVAITSKTLTFEGIKGETKTFRLSLANDNIEEETEKLNITMANLAVAVQGVDISYQATITITDDDDNTAPSGYSVSMDDALIGASEVTTSSFTFAGAEIGTTYSYILRSSEGEGDISGSGKIISATEMISIDDLSILNDGTLTLSITLTDNSGNIGETVNDLMQKDTKAPEVPLVTSISSDTGSSGSDLITNDNKLRFNGSAEAESIIDFYIDGNSVGTTSADSDGSFSFDHSSIILSDGVYAISVKATDKFGNSSALSQVLDITVDTTAPKAAVFTGITNDTGASAKDGITYDDSSLVISGTAAANATYDLTKKGTTISDLSVDDNGDWSYDLSGLFGGTDGSESIKVTIKDAAGNMAEASTFNITLDTSAPDIPEINLEASSDLGINNNDKLTHYNETDGLLFSGNAEVGASVQLSLSYNGIIISNLTAKTEGSGEWFYDAGADFSGMITEGTVNDLIISAVAIDVAGNQSSKGELKIVLDQQIEAKLTPEVGITEVQPSANLIMDFSEDVHKGVGNMIIRQVSNDALVETVDVKSDNVSITEGKVVIDLEENIFLPEAELYVNLDSGTFTDDAGNIFTGISNKTDWNFTMLAASRVNSIDLPEDGFYRIGDQLSFKVTMASPVTIMGSPILPILIGEDSLNTSFLGTATNTTLLTFHYTVKEGDLDTNGITLGSSIELDGGRIVDEFGRDALLIVTHVSSDNKVVIDGIIPDTPVITSLFDDTGVSDSDRITNDQTPIFVGKSEANSAICLAMDDQVLGVVHADHSGDWSFDTSEIKVKKELTEGVHSVTAIATDLAGNNSNESLAFDFTLDLTTPSAPPVDLESGSDSGLSNTDNLSNETRPEVSGTTEPHSIVKVFVEGLLKGETTADAKGDWSLMIQNDWDSGTYEITATSTDLAGNESGEGSALNYNLDVDMSAFTLNPAENQIDVLPDANLIMTFEEDVYKGEGVIRINQSSDDSILEEIEVNSDQVAIEGSVVIIDPNSLLLPPNREFNVTVDSKAFIDKAGNIFEGIKNNTLWSFNSAKAPVVTRVIGPKNGAYGIGESLEFQVFFSSAVSTIGVPSISLTIGESLVKALLSQEVTTGVSATFTHVVLEDQIDLDGIELGPTIDLNGGVIFGSSEVGSRLELNNIKDFSEVRVDGVRPVPQLSSDVGRSTNGSFQMTFSFDEKVTNFAISDIQVKNGLASNFEAIKPGEVWSALITPSADEETSVKLALGAAKDRARNRSVASNTISTIYDSKAPEVRAIQRKGADRIPTGAADRDFRVVFSEEVTGVDVSDFEIVTTGSATAKVNLVTRNDGQTYTINVNGITGEGTIGLNVLSNGSILDQASNPLSTKMSGEFYTTNFKPTDIGLSNTSIQENNAVGDLIADLSTTDADSQDNFTYTLLTGKGDADSESFSIQGDQLFAEKKFNFESNDSYSIRLRTEDDYGGTFEKEVMIEIINEPEAIIAMDGDSTFEATILGWSSTKNWTLINHGDLATELRVVSAAEGFSIRPGVAQLEPGESTTMMAVFTPSEARDYQGKVIFNFNVTTDINEVKEVILKGEGVIVAGVLNKKFEADQVSVYPNPTNGYINIDLSKLNGIPVDINLISSRGVLFRSEEGFNKTFLKLDISKYSSGIYILQFSNEHSLIRKKMIIDK